MANVLAIAILIVATRGLPLHASQYWAAVVAQQPTPVTLITIIVFIMRNTQSIACHPTGIHFGHSNESENPVTSAVKTLDSGSHFARPE